MMLEWVVSSCFLILVVLILRAALGRRISARLRYALWVLVLVRLLFPVQLFIPPLARLLEPVPVPAEISEQMREKSIYVLPIDRIPVEDSQGYIISEDGQVSSANSFGYEKLEDKGETIVRYADKVSPLQLLEMLWKVGSILMASVLLVNNLRFFARLRRVRKRLEEAECPVPVYLAGSLPSPCLFGLPRPAVYVTSAAAEDPAMLRHVLAHELTHYRHLDHIWSILRGLALAVHWWNPLVWLAVVQSRRDGELACDEGALKRLGREERIAYGETLLSLVTAKPSPQDLLSCATTMSGEKRSLRERIRRISCEPKQLVSAVIAVIAVVSVTSVCAFGLVAEDEDDWWRNARIEIDDAGIPSIHYLSGWKKTQYGTPIPAPAEWAEQDLAGRNEASVLTIPPDGHYWCNLVSPRDGWLVVCWGHGIGGADTYVYKTSDGGITWTECAMPGLEWHVHIATSLSPDRIIIAQEVFDGAPVVITKDGGKSWEEIEVSYPVSSIGTCENRVQLFGGDSAVNWTMTSEDLGDTWTREETAPLDGFPPELGEAYTQEVLPYTPDLNHDGKPDQLQIAAGSDGMGWALQCVCETDGEMWSWSDTALAPHVGWNALFLCKVDGEDYLLEYKPYMGQGLCDYHYELFYLDEGRRVTVQENRLDFDIIFNPGFAENHVFDPKAIAAFMDEVNALLTARDTVQLLNTDRNLLETFEREGRLYDSLCFLNDDRDEELTLLENLLRYRNREIEATAVPDMRILMENCTEEDFQGFSKTMKPQAAEGFHRAAEKLTAVNGDETFVSRLTATYAGNSQDRQYQFHLLTTEEENVLCILCEGWDTAMIYSENPADPDSTYLHQVEYAYVYRVEDEGLYQLATQRGFLLSGERSEWMGNHIAEKFAIAQNKSFVQ